MDFPQITRVGKYIPITHFWLTKREASGITSKLFLAMTDWVFHKELSYLYVVQSLTLWD
jgi:hypothetical protein